MVPMFQLAKPLYTAASDVVKKAKLELEDLTATQSAQTPVSAENEPLSTSESQVQSMSECILYPQEIYCLARQNIDDQDKRAPERAPSEASSFTETIKAGAVPTASRVAPLPIAIRRVPLNNSQSALDGGIGDSAAVGDNFVLPGSFDNLQVSHIPAVLQSTRNRLY
ncbi:hypothetical protein TruAng_004569 [Truncatella angustata]|nr:hypothetical protein TruAng_004569 [Truncatella angustata]